MTFKCDLDFQPAWTDASNCTSTPQEKQLDQIILKPMHKWQLWPVQAQFITILSVDLQVWPWPSACLEKCFKRHCYSSRRTTVCAKLFWNPYINVEVMVRTSSIFDHFIIWPSRVTLIFNLSWEMFQMALLLFKENNCANLFWNSYINVEVMARTSSIYDHFIIWPSKVILTFNLPKQTYQIALLLLNENNCAILF